MRCLTRLGLPSSKRLSVSPASASELARPFAMALPSFMQHMGVLERAGIVTSHKVGRTRTYQFALLQSLQLASAWLAEFRNHWERKLEQLDHLLITTHHKQGAPMNHFTPNPALDLVIERTIAVSARAGLGRMDRTGADASSGSHRPRGRQLASTSTSDQAWTLHHDHGVTRRSAVSRMSAATSRSNRTSCWCITSVMTDDFRPVEPRQRLPVASDSPRESRSNRPVTGGTHGTGPSPCTPRRPTPSSMPRWASPKAGGAALDQLVALMST